MSPSLPARGLLALIQVYKWTLSPLIGRECRYLPTCSSYAADAVRAHGAWAGGWMATARLCRCHPWGGSGWDPAPETAPQARWYAPWKLGDWSWRRREPSPLAGEVSAKPAEGGRADTSGAGVVARPPSPTPSPQGGRGR